MADNVKYQCSSCGTPAAEGSKFCTMCGSPVIAVQAEEPVVAPVEEPVEAPVEEPIVEEAPAEETVAEEAPTEGTPVETTNFYYQNPEAEAPEKKKCFFKRHLKLICIIGIAVVLVAAAIIAAFCIFGGSSKYVEASDDIRALYINEDDETIIISGGKVSEYRIDGEATIKSNSLDGEAVLILADKTLYIFDGDLAEVTEDAKSYRLSANGKDVAYVDEDGALVLYSDGDNVEIADEILDHYYVISPDGKQVAFSDKKGVLMLYSGGDLKEIAEDAIPVGVSNGADFIYYEGTDNGVLHVIKGEDDVKLGEYTKSFFSADLAQVIFMKGENYYVSNNGSKKIKISDSGLSLNANVYGYSMAVSEKATVLPINSFGNMYFMDSKYSLWYADSDFDTAEVETKISSFAMAKDSSVVYYLKSGDLYRGKSYNDEFACVAEDVKSFRITSNGDACYYIDNDSVLYYVEGAGEAVEISEDCAGIQMTSEDYLLFVNKDDECIYVTRNGNAAELVFEDIDNLNMDVGYKYFYVAEKDGDTANLYIADGDSDFEMVLSDIEL